MSYTREQTEKIIRIYEENPTRETVEELAEKYEKSVKSIIGKLSREGVYRREVYRSKTGDLPITKVEIVSNICDCLGLEVEHMEGLEKAPKAVLQRLVAGLQRGLNIREDLEIREDQEGLNIREDLEIREDQEGLNIREDLEEDTE